MEQRNSFFNLVSLHFVAHFEPTFVYKTPDFPMHWNLQSVCFHVGLMKGPQIKTILQVLDKPVVYSNTK